MNHNNEFRLPSYSCLFNGKVGEWLDDYHSSLTDVISYVKNHPGIVTHLVISDLNVCSPYINASLIISDLTSIAIRGNGERVIKICPDLAGAKITIPNRIIAEQGIDISTNWSNVGYMQSSEKKARLLVRELKPAIKENKIILRPDRIALFKKGNQGFHAVHCDPDCSQLDWIVSDQDKNSNILPDLTPA